MTDTPHDPLAPDPSPPPSREELRVVRGLTWEPHQSWDGATASVEGHLSTGEVVVVATVKCAARARTQVCHVWMHGGVYEIADAARATLVTGCESLTPATIAEALRRRWLQHLHAEAS